MADQTQFTQFTQFATNHTEFNVARGHFLQTLTQLIRIMRGLGEPLPRGTRMRRDIGLGPERQEPREQVMRTMMMHGIHL